MNCLSNLGAFWLHGCNRSSKSRFCKKNPCPKLQALFYMLWLIKFCFIYNTCQFTRLFCTYTALQGKNSIMQKRLFRFLPRRQFSTPKELFLQQVFFFTKTWTENSVHVENSKISAMLKKNDHIALGSRGKLLKNGSDYCRG